MYVWCSTIIDRTLLYATLRAAPAAAAIAAEPRADWYIRLPGPVRANKKARTWQKLLFLRKLRTFLLDLRDFFLQLRLPQKETATT